MKKNDYSGPPPAEAKGMNSNTLILRVFVLFCLFGCVMSTPAFPQNNLISVSYADMAVVEVLNDLKVRTGYDFFYKKDVIPRSMKTTVTMSGVSLEDVLSKILTVNNLGYIIKDDNVIIGPVGEAQNSTLQAQQKPKMLSIQVKAVDKDKMPIPNVSVRVKDKPYGSVTNRDGTATILLPAQDKIVVVFTFLGLKKKEIPYTGQETILVTMEEDVIDMKDVVVTGYAEISRSDYAGSATLITRKELQQLGRGDVISSLAILDPSFKIAVNNAMGSDPNTMPDFFIRGRTGTPGVKELDALNPADPDDISQYALKNNPSAPIFILDGFEVSQTKIYDLDMNRIERVTILKDAAATAVYGSRAGNGVVVIQTLPPQPGEVMITYSGTLTATFPDLSSYDLLNSEELVEAERLAGVFDGDSSAIMSNGTITYDKKMNWVRQGINTDWMSIPLRSVYNHRHSLTMTGGSQEIRYGLDLSYKREDGVMKGSYRNNVGAALTVDYRWRSLQIKNKVEVDRMNSEESPFGSFSDYYNMKPYLYPYDDLGNYAKTLLVPHASWTGQTVVNPLYETTVGNFYESQYTEIMDYFSIIWRSPDTFWTVRGNLGISFKIEDSNKFTSPFSSTYYTYAGLNEPEKEGKLSTSQVRNSVWNSDISLTYNRSTGGHNMNFRLAGEAYESKGSSLNVVYRGFVNNQASPNRAMTSELPTYRDSNVRRLSTFLQGNYSYLNVYLFDISGRLDGSSVFGSDRKIAPFWSTGFGLNIHNYGFMENIGWVNLLKLTATYGQTGKANFEPYQAKTTYEAILEEHYAYATGIKIKAFGNTELKWEKTRSWNFKIETGLFDNAVNLRFEYYRNLTIDLVEDLTIPASSGFSVYKSNIGEVMNKGIELATTFRLLRTNDWDINFINQLTHNTNVIVKIGDALEEYNKRVDDFFYWSLSLDSKYATSYMKYEEGSSLSAIYGMKSLGIDPGTGKELYLKRDGTITRTWSAQEQQNLGDTEPKVSGTMQLNVRWKNLELYTAFYYKWGGQAYNYTYQSIENVNLKLYNADRRVLIERWKEVGDVTPLKDIKDGTFITRPTSRFVQDENEFRFSSVSLTYNINREWLKRTLKVNSARVTFNMSDVAIISSIKQERGTTYPFARSFNLNLYLQF